MNTIKTPTLCLSMIVKNESKIICRMLDSVVDIIDTFCICDTGSDDNTIDVIQQFFDAKNIKGKIFTENFKDFSYNRNLCLQKSYGMSDYILLLDADMLLVLNNFNKKDIYSKNYFKILQKNNSISYYNIRIIKNNSKCKYIGVTHEYLDINDDSTPHLLDKNTIYIKDIGDGGCKDNKFKRDIFLLSEALKVDKDNPRYCLYLANSYLDINDCENAIKFYKKRLQLKGWNQELWYSAYRIALAYQKLNQDENYLFWLFKAYEILPDRAESIYKILQYHRIKGNYNLCSLFYNIGKSNIQKNISREHFLFIENDVYTYLFDYEYTIFAYYLKKFDINNHVVNILNNSYKNNIRSKLLENLFFYNIKLSPKNTISFTDETNIYNTSENKHIKYYSSSSCLIKNPSDNGYIMNVRYVNYYVNKNGSYTCYKDIYNNDCVCTKNKFVKLDHNLNIINSSFLSKNDIFNSKEKSTYYGIEDIKIYNYKNDIFYIGTKISSSTQTPSKKVGITTGLYFPFSEIPYYKDNKIITQDFKKSSCEKNWVFTIYQNQLCIVYQFYPLTICKQHNSPDHVLIPIIQKDMPKIYDNVRGSTCGFVYNEEIWFVNHLVSFTTPRSYYHMISVFDKDMNLLRYSAPFSFEKMKIEFCLSIVVEDDRVLINYSTFDRTTKIAVFDKHYINSILIFNN